MLVVYFARFAEAFHRHQVYLSFILRPWEELGGKESAHSNRPNLLR